ncbi:uncharacterized protein LOC120345653 [Styela clava]
MFKTLCLLCLILCCRFVIGRLPVDVLPINTFTQSDSLPVSLFSGVYGIVQVDQNYYVLSKNQVSSLKVSSDQNGKAEHRIQKVIEWTSSTSADNLCQHKTRDVDTCNNFVRIFAPKDESATQFIVCGTHSSQPKCRIYKKQKDSFVSIEEFSGSSICPFDPKQTGASIYTGGNIYSATVKDFLGRKPVIYRHGVNSDSQDLERTKRDETWLLDPSFVKFVETSAKVYIFFKEEAVEGNNGLQYSRVAQICKADEGGDHILRKQFTSYQKARLNCSFPGNPPFYFNELKAVTEFVNVPNSPGKKILFAAMNTPSNSIWGSAVCAFLEEDIESTFSKSYLEQHTSTEGVSYWSEKESDPTVKEALSKCQFDGRGKPILTDENLLFVKDHPLKSHSVPTWARDGKSNIPIFMKLNAMYQFTAIAIDTNAGSNGLYLVIILGTTDGKILKIVPPLSQSITESHFVGETAVYDETKCGESDKEVKDIKIDKVNGFILVAFSNCVISVPLCPISSPCSRDCISARDPYCAWDGDNCVNVLKPEGLEQDIANGDVTGLPQCATNVIPPEVIGDSGNGVGKSDNKSTNMTNEGSMNVTTAIVPIKETTATAVAAPIVSSAGFSSMLLPGAIGFIIGALVISISIYVLYLYREKKRKKLASNRQDGGIVTPRMKDSGKNANSAKRNSQGSAQGKQDRINTNSTRRQHSKRSESSLEDDPFLDGNQSEGNANSLEKSKRKREKSANRKSNASSYRREESLEKAHNISVNRQVSRESNHDPGPNNEDPEGELLFSSTEYVQQQPPSPPQNAAFRRTFSTGNGRQDGVVPRQNGRQQIKRQLSLQMPMNTAPAKFYPALTPVRVGTQNPLEIYNQQQQQLQGNFDPAQAPGWHPSPMKAPHGLARQYQTTSLDRKMLKAGGMAHPQQHHDTQQQPRNYSDTLPASGMDDMKVQGRRRYPSESVVIGGSGGRPPPLFFASKQPVYQSIEEETSPLPEQHSPTKYPTNNMPQRNTARMRPNHLPIGSNPDPSGGDPRSPYTVIPYSNPGTPMTEQIPRFAMSPHQTSGYTLPTQLRRQYTVDAPTTRYNNAPPNHHDFNKQFPHPQSVPTMKSYPSNERQARSNPATPEWDGNHNNFFPGPVITSDMRHRNPSGKSQGTPTTPPVKQIQNFVHPDVIPTNNKRDGRGPADGIADPVYMLNSENKPMQSHA